MISILRRSILFAALIPLFACASTTRYTEPGVEPSGAATVVGAKGSFMAGLSPLGTRVTSIGFTSIDGAPLGEEFSEVVVRPGRRSLGVVAHLMHDGSVAQLVHEELAQDFAAGARSLVSMEMPSGELRVEREE